MLTSRQAQFVEEYSTGVSASEAARRAGYGEAGARVAAHRLLTNDNVKVALQARQYDAANDARMTRQEVIACILSAIQMAREQGNPAVIIAGCVQLAKLCGFYEPETIKLELSDDARRMQSKFAVMSDEDLFSIAARTSAVKTDY